MDPSMSLIKAILCDPSNLQKTPLSLITDIAAANHLKPIFRTEEIFLQKTFSCTVKVCNGFPIGKGSGSNKRDAKQRASQNALEGLATMIGCKPILPPAVSVITGSTSFENGSNNPIGELQELGSQRHEHPVYRLVEDRGHFHDKRFTMEVLFSGLRCEGSGRNKKVAKRVAAEMMLELVKGEFASPRKSLPHNLYNCTKFVGEGAYFMKEFRPKSRSFYDYQLEGLNVGFPKNIRSGSQYVARYQEEDFIIPLQKWKETEKKSRHIDLRAVTQLEEKVQRLGFALKYHKVPELSKSREIQCFVEVPCNPVCVQAGQGETLELAKADAAKNAVVFLERVILPAVDQSEH